MMLRKARRTYGLSFSVGHALQIPDVMTFITVTEFEALLVETQLSTIVQEHVFDGQPYAFRGKPNHMSSLRSHVCAALGSTDPENVVVVGSGRTGFSLDPNNFGRRFNSHSDIDVLVVDDILFDMVWKSLLDWNHPLRHRRQVPGPEGEWAAQRMNDIYWGWIDPKRLRLDRLPRSDALRPLRDLVVAWLDAFDGLGRITDLSTRDFSGRLYRTWNHALLYQVEGLRRIRSGLKDASEVQ